MCCYFNLQFPIAQKKLAILDWKAENSLNTFLVAKMREQYTARTILLEDAFRSKEKLLAYIQTIKQRIKWVMGELPPRSDLDPKLTGRLKRDGYNIEKIVYQSFAGHHVTANLYLPAGEGKFPAALLFCGHENSAKATESYQQTAILLVKSGFAVLVIDPVSQAERMQLTDSSGKALTRGGTTEHTLLNASSNVIGTSLPAYELFDNIRGLDYLCSRKEIDTSRIGCIGNSGGAIQAIYFAGMDERVKLFVACSYLAMRNRTLELSGPADGCAQIPREGALLLEMNDYLLAAAPKPILILAGRYDFIDYEGTKEAFDELKKAFVLLGCPNAVNLFTVDDGHGISKPKRETAVRWFRQWFMHDSTTIVETDVQTSKPDDLQVLASGQVSKEFAGEISINQRNLLCFDELKTQRKNFFTLGRDTIVYTIAKISGVNLVVSPISLEDKGPHEVGKINFRKIIARREGQPPIPLLLYLPSQPRKTVILLDENGKESFLDSTLLMARLQEEQAVIILADLRGMGETKDKAGENDPKYFNDEYRNAMLALHIGKPLAGQRTEDILTVIKLAGQLVKEKKLAIEIYAGGRAALPSILAAAFIPEIKKIELRQTFRSFREMYEKPAEKNWYSEVIPGSAKYFDISDLVDFAGKNKFIFKP